MQNLLGPYRSRAGGTVSDIPLWRLRRRLPRCANQRKSQMCNYLDDFIFGYAIGARPFKVSAQLLRPIQSDSNRPAHCGSVLIYLPDDCPRNHVKVCRGLRPRPRPARGQKGDSTHRSKLHP